MTGSNPRSITPPRPRVVIIGGGFAGMRAARRLRNAPVDVTVLDRTNHHLFQPLLYQVATAALSPGDIAWPVRTVFRRQRNLAVVMAEATGVDTQARVVRAGDNAQGAPRRAARLPRPVPRMRPPTAASPGAMNVAQ